MTNIPHERSRKRTAGLLIAVLGLLGSNIACGPSISLQSVHDSVQAHGLARVVLVNHGSYWFNFTVYNESPFVMIIDRDAVRLATSAGVRNREPGGLIGTYVVPAGGSHDCNLEFSIESILAGETVRIEFQDALIINGQRISIAPVPFNVR